MKKTSLFIVILFVFPIWLTTNCTNPQNNKTDLKGDDLKGTISLSGAFALYPITVKWAEEFKKIHPHVRIDISAGGAGKGMVDALSGMVDLGMFSRHITTEEINKGAWYIAVTKDAVLPTINYRNPSLAAIKKQGFTKEVFQQLFLNQNNLQWRHFIGDKNESRINCYTRSDACGAAEMWGNYLGKNQESLKGIGVYGDPGMADAVKKDVSGIGYNNVIYVYDIQSRKKYEGLEVIPVDLNENGKIDQDENFYDTLDEIMEAIKQGKYPSPPSRDLYFVANGKPKNKVVIEFLKWILNDGQKYVAETGYVALSPEKITSELDRLNQE